jgi:hypothetical protein
MGVVLAHVGQQRAAVDIANRVQPKMTGHPKPLIAPDRLAQRQPNGL